VVGDEPPVGLYPPRRGGRAVPDRSREPRIGPACYDTDTVAPPSAFSEELRSGVEIGTRGNTELQKTAQEFGDSLREARGVRTRPERPGRHA
jgi:hypothetical protein